MRRICLLLCLLALWPMHARAAVPLAVHVVGDVLVDGTGQPVLLRGASRSGSEYACMGTKGAVFDGPVDDASIAAMQSWGLDAVRIPLNEDCWLGINGATVGGQAYQTAIAGFVQRLTARGMYAILDLHWSAPGTLPAKGQEPAPDLSHSVAFWVGVARAFMGKPSAIFELYNEPDPIPYSPAYPGGFGAWQGADFACLRLGCTVTSTEGPSYQSVGTQILVDAIRSTGAGNVILVGGIQAAETITQYLGDGNLVPLAGQYMPVDVLRQLAVSVHSYAADACGDVGCWDATYAPVAGRYPLVATELGDTDGSGRNLAAFIGWAAGHHVSYLAWTWDAWNSPQALIANYDGTPTPYGAVYKALLGSGT